MSHILTYLQDRLEAAELCVQEKKNTGTGTILQLAW